MFIHVREYIKQVINGTPLESTFRKIYVIFQRLNLIRLAKEDTQTQEIIKLALKTNSNCINVGCFSGRILRMMLESAPHGNHFAFEPMPKFYSELRRLFGQLPNLRLYNIALSDVKGESSFQNVISNPAFSGLQKRRYPHSDVKIQEIVVKTDLLDNIIPEHVQIHLIKVDVEGAELQVFRGAIKTIKRCQPIIIFEHGRGGADYYGTTPDDIYDLLSTKCKLRLSLLDGWIQNTAGKSLSKEAFIEEFAKGKNYYFVAYPIQQNI